MLSWSGTTFCQVLIVHQELNRGFRKIVRGREFPGSSVSKEFACNAGDPGSIPGLRRSPREGNGNPLQYSRLENPTDMDKMPHLRQWGLKSQTRLSN